MKIRLFGTIQDSIVDGPGLRYVVFVQGCLHHCIGCHNPQSHDVLGGYIDDTSHLLQEMRDNPLLDGVTFSGGEPFLQCQPLIELAKEIKKNQLHLIIYSGYTFDEIMHLSDGARCLLSYCDTLIDGRFIQEQKSLDLMYEGSKNQRIINGPLLLHYQKIVLQKINEYGEFV